MHLGTESWQNMLRVVPSLHCTACRLPSPAVLQPRLAVFSPSTTILSLSLGWQTPKGWLHQAAVNGYLDSLTCLHVGLGARVRSSDLLALAARHPPLAELRLIYSWAAEYSVSTLLAACGGVQHLSLVYPACEYVGLT